MKNEIILLGLLIGVGAIYYASTKKQSDKPILILEEQIKEEPIIEESIIEEPIIEEQKSEYNSKLKSYAFSGASAIGLGAFGYYSYKKRFPIGIYILDRLSDVALKLGSFQLYTKAEGIRYNFNAKYGDENVKYVYNIDTL